MTDNELTIYIRSLLSESIAKYWTEPDVTTYKKVAMSIVQADFYFLLYPKSKKLIKANLAKDDPYVLLPDDCYKIGRVSKTETGKDLKHLGDEEYGKFKKLNGDPVGWTWEDSKLRVVPTPSVNKAEWLTIWYLPKMDIIDKFPDVLCPIVGIQAVLNGKIKDKATISSLIALLAFYTDAAHKELTVTQLQEPDLMGDEELDDRYEF